MMRLAALACLVVVSLAASVTSPFYYDVELNPYWETYKTSYNKIYTSSDEAMRRSIWEKNLKFIRDHNLEADLGQHSYRLGINEYADLTHEEYLKFMTGARVGNSTRKGVLFLAPNNVQVPDEMDWRDKGYVTPVKNQGQCGSCWAFSTTGSVEGQHFRAAGTLVSLSEQNLVDCSKDNNGCDGGMMDYAFEFIIKNGGIDTEDSYPYEAVESTCRFKTSSVGATISAFTDVTSQDEDALKTAVGTVGPVSVAIDAAHPTFQLYKSGVYDEPECSPTALDHGVLAVGYGTENGVDYWLVKNSWGESWGLEGYIKMSRNKSNQCGIATMASYPQV